MASSSNPLYVFLLENKVLKGTDTVHWEKIVLHGYSDDFDYFANEMTESDVTELIVNCGLNFVQGKKLMTAWKKLQEADNNNNETNETLVTNCPDDIPSEVQKLIINNPVSEQQTYFNNVVRELFETSFALFTSTNEFFTYVQSQRQLRFDIDVKVKSQLALIDSFNTSSEGNWINARKFDDKSYVITAKDVIPSGKTLNFLNKKLEIVDNIRKEITKRIGNVYKKIGQGLRGNEIQFYEKKVEELDSVYIFLNNTHSNISTKEKSTTKTALPSLVEKYEKSRTRQRKRENTIKGEKIKKMCLDKGAFRCLDLLQFSSDEDTVLNKTKISSEDIVEAKFDVMCPRLHLPGLKELVKNEVFSEDARLHDLVNNKILILEEKEKATAKANQKKKELRALKPKSPKQGLIHPINKNTSLPTSSTCTITKPAKRQVTLFDKIMEKRPCKSVDVDAEHLKCTDLIEIDIDCAVSKEFKEIVASSEGSEVIHFNN